MMVCREFICANAGCQNTIHLHHEAEAKLRRTHETFYCPAGHSNYFAGKSTEQRRLEAETRRADRFQELWEEALDQREDWKLLAKSCPFECGFRVHRKSSLRSIRFALQAHLIEEHNAVMPQLKEETCSAFSS